VLLHSRSARILCDRPIEAHVFPAPWRSIPEVGNWGALGYPYVPYINNGTVKFPQMASDGIEQNLVHYVSQIICYRILTQAPYNLAEQSALARSAKCKSATLKDMSARLVLLTRH
jgi:hypothetical protein